MPEKEREKLLRGLLAKKKSVHEFELISQGKESSTDADIKRYSIRMGEVIGRPVEVSFHGSKKKGRLVLDFFSLDDLDDLAKALGYDPSDDY
jgi:ParB family chromosome partitioning protein